MVRLWKAATSATYHPRPASRKRKGKTTPSSTTTTTTTNNSTARSCRMGVVVLLLLILYPLRTNLDLVQQYQYTPLQWSSQSVESSTSPPPISSPPPTTTLRPKRTVSELTRGQSTAAQHIVCPAPLQPLYDRLVVPEEQEATSGEPHQQETTPDEASSPPPHGSIPKAIHVAWIRRSANTPEEEPYLAPAQSRCLAPDMFDIVAAWQTNFPSYNFYFHDDYAVDTLLGVLTGSNATTLASSSTTTTPNTTTTAPPPFSSLAHDYQQYWSTIFPQLHPLLQACVQFGSAMKVDIWRILILYKYGGFYSDFDQGPGPTLTETTLLGNETFFSLSDSWNRPSQWLFGVEPHHPILYHTMTRILRNLQHLPDISKVKLVFVTGPDALKHGYAAAISTGDTGPEPYSSIFRPGWHRTRGEDSKLVRKMAGDRSTIYQNSNDRVPLVRTTTNSSSTSRNTTETTDQIMVTKQARIEYEMKTVHWQQHLRQERGNVQQGSCQHHLELYENRTNKK